MRWLLLVLVLSFAPVAEAQEVMTIPPGEDVIITMEKGEPAPYRGQLFNVDTAIRWGFWLQQYKLRLKEDVAAEQRACKIKLEYKGKELQIQNEKYVAVATMMDERLLRSEKSRLSAEHDLRNPPFWTTVEFGILIGTIATAGLAALTVWALDTLKSD